MVFHESKNIASENKTAFADTDEYALSLPLELWSRQKTDLISFLTYKV